MIPDSRSPRTVLSDQSHWYPQSRRLESSDCAFSRPSTTYRDSRESMSHITNPKAIAMTIIDQKRCQARPRLGLSWADIVSVMPISIHCWSGLRDSNPCSQLGRLVHNPYAKPAYIANLPVSKAQSTGQCLCDVPFTPLAGPPSRTRTCNHRLRRLVLYPVELWADDQIDFQDSDPASLAQKTTCSTCGPRSSNVADASAPSTSAPST